MAINKKTRDEVHKKFDGHCAYCGKEITIKNMQVDHMYPKAYGESYARMVGKVELESIENYMPSCRSCNHYKRALSFEGFRKQMLTLHERIEKIYIVKVAMDFGLLTLKQFDGKFYFEKIRRRND
jgi:5-methylcytosine-specific restriction endonuclease McrA